MPNDKTIGKGLVVILPNGEEDYVTSIPNQDLVSNHDPEYRRATGLEDKLYKELEKSKQVTAEVISKDEAICEQNKYLKEQNNNLKAKVEELTAKLPSKDLEELRKACTKENDEICQILGKVLGYMWYVNDPQTFPNAKIEDGVFVGGHVAVTLAEEAAKEIITTKQILEGAHKTIRNLVEEIEKYKENQFIKDGVINIHPDDDDFYER